MHKILLICFLAIIVFVNFISCKQNNQVDINYLVVKFSDLECRAFSLREQRFALANKIRFTEDSVSKQPAGSLVKNGLEQELNSYLKDKDKILSSSLRLADTIKLQLDSIVKIKLKSPDEVQQFDKALSIEMERRHCK